MPVHNFDVGDIFRDFTSDTNQEVPLEASNSFATENNFNSQSPSIESKLPKKNLFQVKSGIWADSLSRGLIDMNITARYTEANPSNKSTKRKCREFEYSNRVPKCRKADIDFISPPMIDGEVDQVRAWSYGNNSKKGAGLFVRAMEVQSNRFA